MNLQDKIEEWNRQLEQAQEYNLWFDWETVKEMIETIEDQQKENHKIKEALKRLKKRLLNKVVIKSFF